MSVQSGHWRVARGQVVAVQMALAVVLAGSGHPATVGAGATLLALALARPRGRWLYEWVRAGAGLLARRSRVTIPDLARPAVAVARDRPPVLLTDRYGEAAVLELGQTSVGGAEAAPPIADLTGLGATGSAVSVKPLVYGFAAGTGDDPPAVSYRELASGPAVTVQRTLLVVRVPPRADLHTAVRAVRQRLAPVPVRPLDLAGWEGVLDDLGCHPPVRERWSGVAAGGLRHVTYRLAGPPGALANLLPDLLALPAVVTAVAPYGGAVTLRVALDPAGSGAGPVESVLAARVAGGPVRVRRLDGEHLPALVTTSPLPDPYAGAGAEVAELPLGVAGFLLGRDRAGAPVHLPLGGSRPVRVVLAGPPAWSHLLAWRGLGAGARVVVHTGHPRSWQRFEHAAGGRRPLVLAPDSPPGPPARQPLLMLIEGEAGVGWPAPAAGRWQAHVVRRDRLSAADVDLLTRADLVLATVLDERAATLVSAALGLGRGGARLRADTAATLIVVGGGAAREVQVGLTGAERVIAGNLSVTSGQSGLLPGEQDVVRHGSIRAWESS